MNKKLVIHLVGGWTDIWDAEKGDYDDFSDVGTALIIKKNGEIVSRYNMAFIICYYLRCECAK